MGLRETLNKNPIIGISAAGAIIALSLFLITRQLFCGGPKAAPPRTKAFYTTDEGKTTFAENMYRVTPFTHEGKEAVEAIMYKCENGEPFVLFLERYPDPDRQRMKDWTPEQVKKEMGDEIIKWRKLPGDSGWKLATDTDLRKRIDEIKKQKCGEGKAVPHYPEE